MMDRRMGYLICAAILFMFVVSVALFGERAAEAITITFTPPPYTPLPGDTPSSAGLRANWKANYDNVCAIATALQSVISPVPSFTPTVGPGSPTLTPVATATPAYVPRNGAWGVDAGVTGGLWFDDKSSAWHAYHEGMTDAFVFNNMDTPAPLRIDSGVTDISIKASTFTFNSDSGWNADGFEIPPWGTATPKPTAGTLRWNADTALTQVYNGSSWSPVIPYYWGDISADTNGATCDSAFKTLNILGAGSVNTSGDTNSTITITGDTPVPTLAPPTPAGKIGFDGTNAQSTPVAATNWDDDIYISAGTGITTALVIQGDGSYAFTMSVLTPVPTSAPEIPVWGTFTPAADEGTFRYNKDQHVPEYHDQTAWRMLGGWSTKTWKPSTMTPSCDLYIDSANLPNGPELKHYFGFASQIVALEVQISVAPDSTDTFIFTLIKNASTATELEITYTGADVGVKTDTCDYGDVSIAAGEYCKMYLSGTSGNDIGDCIVTVYYYPKF